jgi:hypothetical protein
MLAIGTRHLAALGLALASILVAVPTTASGDRVIARGSFGELTEGSAVAFHEALLFSLGYVGRPDVAAQLPRDAVVAELARVYPTLAADEQRDLANARQIWSQVQTSWASQPPAARREFVALVLGFAFGESATGGGAAQGGGSAGGGSTVMPSVDPGYEGQGCWASAGCTGYDAGSDTYHYESFDGGGYDPGY